ncbi:MAG: hypothetical protein ACPHJV_04380, partial [Miltoncostaeaceae bacterium]
VAPLVVYSSTAKANIRAEFTIHPPEADMVLVVGGVGDSGLAGARPKVEQLVYARRVHVAAGG